MTTNSAFDQRKADRLSALEVVLDAGGYAYWEFDLDTGRLSWDERMFELYGVDREQFTGVFEDWAAALHPDDLAEAASSFENAVASRSTFRSDFRVVTGGPVRWVRAIGASAWDSGQRSQMYGFNFDVTEEVVFAHERARLAVLAERTSDIVVMTDASQRIEWVNDAFCQITGFASEEAIGKRPSELVVGPETSADVRTEIRGALEKGEGIRRVVVNHKKNGDPYWVDLEVLPVCNERGEVCSYISLGTDITAQRELEHRLRGAAQMESLGRLAGAVANDFNNLLTAVLGTSDLLERVSDDPLAVRELSGDLRSVALSARDLTSQLLSLSRTDALAANPLEVCSELWEMRRTLQPMVGDGCTLELKTEDDAWVCMPRSHFRQIVTNLVVNASQSMHGVGRVTLSVEPDEAARAVKVSIADEGPGIPNSVMATIFEPFVTTRGRESGTGLGLSIVQTLAARAEGRVLVANSETKGATFTVVLPAIDAPRRAVRPMLTGTNRACNAVCSTILVVDDNPIVLRTMVELCRGIAETVLSAPSADAALFVLSENDVDVMLTDVRMPRVSGVQLASLTRKAFPEVRVILMTGYTDESLEESIEAGDAHDVLRKPFELRELRTRIAQLPKEENRRVS